MIGEIQSFVPSLTSFPTSGSPPSSKLIFSWTVLLPPMPPISGMFGPPSPPQDGHAVMCV